MQRCDFRDAELRYTHFYSVTIDQVQLPGWPHITLLSPNAGAKPGPEPHIFIRRPFEKYSVEFAMDYIAYVLERMTVDGGSSITVMHVQELVRDRARHEALRERLEHLGHPRIRF